jgi:phosphatidate cytidylyltransferase
VGAVIFTQAELALPALVVAVSGAAIVGSVYRSGWLAAGVIYAASLGMALVLLRDDPGLGLTAVAFVLVSVWASDTGAYIAGRTLGGPKLWPRVSPNKTWSGFIGGTLAGVVAGLLVAVIGGVPVTLILAVIALALAVASAGGDLFESALKRRFGVKDSSAIIPGHGGLMDRVDGLTTASILAAIVGLAHSGPDRMGEGLLLW